MERQHATTSSHVPQSLPCPAPPSLPLCPIFPCLSCGQWQSSCENAKNVDFVENAKEVRNKQEARQKRNQHHNDDAAAHNHVSTLAGNTALPQRHNIKSHHITAEHPRSEAHQLGH
ncbi:hypothetical protein ACLKA7_015433 [Drosophila subpalustris]